MRSLSVSPCPFVAALAVGFGGLSLSACDEASVAEVPIGVELAALTGTACGDPSAPNPGADPFAEIQNLSVAVSGVDVSSGEFRTLASTSTRLQPGLPIVLPNIPEGPAREVVVIGEGSSGTWYGRDTGLAIRRNEETTASLMLSRLGTFGCVPTPQTLDNVLFPATVSLGDGRLLVTGGFRAVNATAISDPTDQAFIFDAKTGAREDLGGMGVELARGAHAMVHVPAAGQVIIIGGASEIGVDAERDFPFILDNTRSLDDAVIFDIATKTFRRSDSRMDIGRAFPRLQLMADNTVLVTGGGQWPLTADDDRYVEADFYDHQAEGGLGAFLNIPKLRSFYPRAGHSVSLIGTTREGLSEVLIWGGTTLGASLGNPAEIYRQSGRQRDGVNGTFGEVVIVGEAPSFVYFHETTPLGGGRFLVTGGTAHRDGRLRAPAQDEAWLLTYTNVQRPTVEARRMAGFGPGRVFHSAHSPDGRHVHVIGGWSGLGAVSAGNFLTTFDLDARPAPWTVETATSAPRGGHAAALAPNGLIFLVGGETTAEPGAISGRLSAEIFTPSVLPRP